MIISIWEMKNMNLIKFFNKRVASKTLQQQADILQKLLPAAAQDKEILLVEEPRISLRQGRIWREGSPRALTPAQLLRIAPAGPIIETVLEGVFDNCDTSRT
jgi:hypothetical protein